MSDVTLTITVQDEGKVVARTDDDATAYGTINLDALRLSTINIFEEWLRKRKITQSRELRVLGSHLYAALFDDKIKTFFETTRKEAGNERMRVRLQFQKEAASLSTLPWEYLYCPDSETGEGYFLSTSVDLVLYRFIYQDKGNTTPLPQGEPVRILIVVSSPPPMEIEATPVIEAIQKQQDTLKNYQITIDVLEQPTTFDLYDKLNEVNPHIVHFIGHGRFDRNRGSGEIALLDGNGDVFWQEDKDFANTFVQSRATTGLVFLHLCQEVMTDLQANFAGLAPRLIRAGIKAVVAMHYPIYTDAAVVFCRSFYRALLNQARVDDAVQTARYRVKVLRPQETPNIRDFGTPALYMYSSKSLLPPPAPAGSVPKARATGNVGTAIPQPEPDDSHSRTESILAAGEAVIDNMALELNDKMACYQEIADLSAELAGKSPSGAKKILREHFRRATGKVKIVVLAMLESA